MYPGSICFHEIPTYVICSILCHSMQYIRPCFCPFFLNFFHSVIIHTTATSPSYYYQPLHAKSTMSIPKYSSSRPVQAALHRIKNPPTPISYEHHVSSWAGTMLKKVFHSDDYTLSSEVIDPYEKSKPDFLIEKLTNQDKLVRHLYVELKKVGGDHFEKALDQATKHIRATIEEESETVKECFVVIQRGLDIGFFEYHARQEDLEGFPNFRGCVSLTQAFRTDQDMPYTDEDIMTDQDTQNYDPMDKIDQSLQRYVKFDDQYRRIIVSTTLEGLKQLSFGNYRGNNLDLLQIRNDARLYTVPCVLNIEQHQELIDYLFHYMSLQTPRIIIPDP